MIPLSANRVGCRLHFRVTEYLREDRSGWDAVISLTHNVGGDNQVLFKERVNTEIAVPSPLSAIKLIMAGREIAGDEVTLDAIAFLFREEP